MAPVGRDVHNCASTYSSRGARAGGTTPPAVADTRRPTYREATEDTAAIVGLGCGWNSLLVPYWVSCTACISGRRGYYMSTFISCASTRCSNTKLDNRMLRAYDTHEYEERSTTQALPTVKNDSPGRQVPVVRKYVNTGGRPSQYGKAAHIEKVTARRNGHTPGSYLLNISSEWWRTAARRTGWGHSRDWAVRAVESPPVS